jgi:hypothetical protein
MKNEEKRKELEWKERTEGRKIKNPCMAHNRKDEYSVPTR